MKTYRLLSSEQVASIAEMVRSVAKRIERRARNRHDLFFGRPVVSVFRFEIEDEKWSVAVSSNPKGEEFGRSLVIKIDLAGQPRELVKDRSCLLADDPDQVADGIKSIIEYTRVEE